MKRLVRRREVWWPTAWGWLTMAAVAALVVLGVGRGAPTWLAPEAPARGPDGQGARTLVVEGWLSRSELDQAAALLRRGQYRRVFTSGGPIEEEDDVGGWHDFATRAAAYLKDRVPGDVVLTAVPAPFVNRDRTYLSARLVRDRLRATGQPIEAIDVFSAGAHGRRSRLLYRMAFGSSVDVGVLTARPPDYDRWWASSARAKGMIDEMVSLAWTNCCFWPDASR